MANKKKNQYEKIIIEDIELKPQFLGYTYQKKNNVGRVIVIFAIFILIVYFINDISVFVNKLLGKETAPTIESGVNKKPQENKPNNDKKEVDYKVFDESLVINENNMMLNNFHFNNYVLSFDVSNSTDSEVDVRDKRFFIEVYTASKTLLERHKVDIEKINVSSKVSFEFNVNSEFYFIAFVEKTVDDYPEVGLRYDENSRLATISCRKGIDTLVYTFSRDDLVTIKHTITDNDVNSSDYYTKYSYYQNIIPTYNNINGVNATFNGSLNGYTAVIDIDLAVAELDKLEQKYYYNYEEMPKVVKFEMQTYGFNCT